MRISDWSSDVCSSDLPPRRPRVRTSLCRTCRLNPPAQASTGDVPSALRRLVAAHLVGRRVAVPFERARPARALALVVAIVLEARLELGRSSCWESVCRYWLISVVAGYLKKKRT